MARLLTLILFQPQTRLTGMPIETSADIHLDNPLVGQENALRQMGTVMAFPIYRNHDDHGIYKTETDNTGKPLFYLSTHQLAFALSELPLLSEWDQSVMKFLSSLDPTIKVIPWWH